MWFCIDYHRLNRITKLDEFPLPRFDDTLDPLSGAKYLTTLDLALGYWQVPMEQSSQEKTAFATPFWTTRIQGKCQHAFDQLKELLQISPVLCFPDFSRPFILETDASGTGLGAVLAQELPDGTTHPIAYASWSLQNHQQNYGIMELEGLGVVWAVKNLRAYLYGHKCTVFTDQEALKSLLNTPKPSGKLARWGMALKELDLTIVYRSGRHNSNSDALSRCPLPTSIDDHPAAKVMAVITEKTTVVTAICTVKPRRRLGFFRFNRRNSLTVTHLNTKLGIVM